MNLIEYDMCNSSTPSDEYKINGCQDYIGYDYGFDTYICRKCDNDKVLGWDYKRCDDEETSDDSGDCQVKLGDDCNRCKNDKILKFFKDSDSENAKC